MNLSPEDKVIGKENFYAALGSDVKGPGGEPSRREFLAKRIEEGLAANDVPGWAYFGYEKSVGDGGPVRVGVIGTGDEGSVLIGALNPEYIAVRSFADIRPYNVHRAFHGDTFGAVAQAARCGLMKKYGWKTEDEARKNVKVYGPYEELIANAKNDGVEAVIIALPLHLHAPAAVAAMRAGLHVLTEKLMGQTVHACKEMSRVAAETKKHLATGHQRHYNILYDDAVDMIRRGLLGDLHYIRAQWHRANLPGNDSWQQPLPEDAALVKELDSWKKELAKSKPTEAEAWAKKIAQREAQIADKILDQKGPDGKTGAERFGYVSGTIKDGKGTVVYSRPAIEELIRWRLWDRTGGGLMAELGSHQLDAASIFIAAMHGGVKQHPLSVAAASNRPVFRKPDRDVEDHVYCLFEFPAPGYDPKDRDAAQKKIGVAYATINGNGFGGYGETVLGTKGTLLLETEKDAMLYKTSDTSTKIKVALDVAKRPAIVEDVEGDPQSVAIGQMSVKDAGRGYQQQLEHWAWCIRKNPDVSNPDVHPRCYPKVAMGDAVIALTTNMAARKGERIEFDEKWFDPDDDATPEGVKPDVTRYES